LIDPFSIFIEGAQQSRFGVDVDIDKAIGGFSVDRVAITPLYLPYRYYDDWKTTLGVPVTVVIGGVVVGLNGASVQPFDSYASGIINISGDVLLSYTASQNLRLHGFLGGGSVDATYRLFINGVPKAFNRTSAAERNARINFTNESSLILYAGDILSVYVKPTIIGAATSGTFEAYIFGSTG
jgi:hypothetical protein